MTPALGVCYYPEHWPEERWAQDAAQMAETGITWVRIGEFAWSRLEPEHGRLEFRWLDQAVETLANAGLKIVLGTPTAAPPRWMLARHTDMLAIDADGRPRNFGSRRHYCFSHDGYRAAAVRITSMLADRYGRDNRIAAWQIDNEYGCHDTTLSYSPAAKQAFQMWLRRQYGDVDMLNAAWGNAFWSMDYGSFSEVELPNLTVTQANPAHVLAFRRFSSDQVVHFNKVQVDAVRARSDAPLIHNYMGRVLDFDHFATGEDLDIASWDSYPIGFLSDRLEASADHKARYLRQGDPDMQAFHHDLYRAVGRGRMWVMEQQPGPVNWAPFNPAPLPGMVRLWSLEAIAHGAEVVSYFRWRQVPFGQEQMHAGLLDPAGNSAAGLAEAAQVAKEISELGPLETTSPPVALIFDYASQWAWEALPHGADFDYFRLVFSAYRALRKAGLSVDILPSTHRDFDAYTMVLAPGLANAASDLVGTLEESKALCIFGPRSLAVTSELSIPAGDRPTLAGLDARITLVESLPPDQSVPVAGGGALHHWFEHLEGGAQVRLKTKAGAPLLMGDAKLWYLAGWPDDELWFRIISGTANALGLETQNLPDGLRLRQAGDLTFAFNYGPEPVKWNGKTLAPAGVAWDKTGA